LPYFTNKEAAMEVLQISGTVGSIFAGIIAIIAGVIVLIQPKILAWVVGAYLIIIGAFRVLAFFI
jgi:uncharacterized membrane protein HdeD (DUF308 family)